MSASDPMLEAALDYAGRGWPVLPLHSVTEAGGCTCGNAECGSPGKHPRNRRGLTDATHHESIIRSWWKRWPGSNIGLRTGVAFDVLDDDSPGGTASIELCDGYGYEHPDELTVLTGGGGRHLYFAPPTGLGNRAKFLPSLDYRGEGGYVVAPPSLHVSGRTYEWQ